MKLRTGLVLLAFLLLFSGCETEKQPPPQSYLEALEQLAEENGVSLGEDAREAIGEDARQDAQALAAAGDPTGAEALEEEYLVQALEEPLMAALYGELHAPREDVEDWYAQRLAAVEKAFAENPGLFKNQQDSYDLYGGVPPLVVPEGYLRFHHILLPDQTAADQVTLQLEEGADFQGLLEEFGTDPGMDREPYKTLGYLTGPYPFAQDLVEELKDAALSLEEVGDLTTATSPAGVHVIRLSARLEPRTLPLEEVEGQIQALLDAQLRRRELQALAGERMAG